MRWWHIHLTNSPLEWTNRTILGLGRLRFTTKSKLYVNAKQSKLFFFCTIPFHSTSPSNHCLFCTELNKEHLQQALLEIHNCLRQWSFNVSSSLDRQKVTTTWLYIQGHLLLQWVGYFVLHLNIPSARALMLFCNVCTGLNALILKQMMWWWCWYLYSYSVLEKAGLAKVLGDICVIKFRNKG